MAALILIVEDEQDLASTLEYNLQQEGYLTRAVHNGTDGLEAARRLPQPALIILDLMLPDLSGIEVCRELKRNDDTRSIPVLMLTARGEEVDRVVGFEVGAEDYVVKPFSVRELILRVHALRRRAQVGSEREPHVASFGSLRLDREAHRVWVDDDEITLTPLEFKLLTVFLSRRGRVQSRDILLTDVWGMSPDLSTRTVDTHIKRLREKLGAAGAYIETLRGVGYRFTDELTPAQNR